MDGLFNAGPKLPDEAKFARQLARILAAHIPPDDAVTLARFVLVGEVAGVLRARLRPLSFGLILPPLARFRRGSLRLLFGGDFLARFGLRLRGALGLWPPLLTAFLLQFLRPLLLLVLGVQKVIERPPKLPPDVILAITLPPPSAPFGRNEAPPGRTGKVP